MRQANFLNEIILLLKKETLSSLNTFKSNIIDFRTIQ